MDILKKIFPISYRWGEDSKAVILGATIYSLIGIFGIGMIAPAIGFIIAAGGITPAFECILAAGGSDMAAEMMVFGIFSFFIGACGLLVSLYCLAGIVIQLLVFFNVLSE
ncbi:MAG: hypothetical protein IKC31_04020 [Clostridia bacterium]|nr:hypothetical protein [Clostridia bacterium]